jgi:hypothetical protein
VIKLFEVATNAELGTITEAQLQFMIDQLEEESADDQDYYINADTLDMFEQRGGDAALCCAAPWGLARRWMSVGSANRSIIDDGGNRTHHDRQEASGRCAAAADRGVARWGVVGGADVRGRHHP